MPHISKNKIPNYLKKEIDERVINFLTETKIKTRKDIFYEIFTYTERIMIAKRIAMIYLISNNTPTYTISKILKVSPSTVDRFKNNIDKKYKNTALWVKNYGPMNKILETLYDIISIPFDIKKKSLKRMMEERSY